MLVSGGEKLSCLFSEGLGVCSWTTGSAGASAIKAV